MSHCAAILGRPTPFVFEGGTKEMEADRRKVGDRKLWEW